jgi:hypothetical protein
LWQEFYEAFDTHKKKPVLECKHCCDIIQHPLLVGKQAAEGKTNRRRSGVTTGMKRHLENCKRYSKTHGKFSGLMDKFVEHLDERRK